MDYADVKISRRSTRKSELWRGVGKRFTDEWVQRNGINGFDTLVILRQPSKNNSTSCPDSR